MRRRISWKRYPRKSRAGIKQLADAVASGGGSTCLELVDIACGRIRTLHIRHLCSGNSNVLIACTSGYLRTIVVAGQRFIESLWARKTDSIQDCCCGGCHEEASTANKVVAALRGSAYGVVLHTSHAGLRWVRMGVTEIVGRTKYSKLG